MRGTMRICKRHRLAPQGASAASSKPEAVS